ncbi:MAG TPA: hypothetical protein VH186_21185 [Chloroflexia bacterium]|nr:hypothetical protein [Chloroflexia bacterium]
MSRKRISIKSVIMSLFMVVLLSAVLTVSAMPVTVDAANQANKATHHQVKPQKVGQPTMKPKPQPRLTQPPPPPPNKKGGKKSKTVGSLALNEQVATSAVTTAALVDHSKDPRDMKILLINTDAPNYPDYDYQGMTAFLNQLGVPFDSFNAINNTLTDSTLWDGLSHGYYQGIILTSGSLVYYDPTTNSYPTAFTDAEWTTLANYETMFGVRQATTYTYPGYPDSYGLSDPTYAYQDTSVTPLQANLTANGKTVFSYLNTSSPITIQYAWTYLATVAPGENVTPLLTTSNGYTIAAIKTYSDGRQNLAITAENNSFLIHSQLLSYGIINWVTKGIFLGERHVTMDVQPDDLFIDDDIWDTQAMTDTTGLTFRMAGSDFNAFINWQNTARTKYPLAKNLKIEWPFNAEGTTGIYSPDTLTSAAKSGKANFNWINHTYTHQNLDYVDAATTQTELQKNNNFASSNGFSPYYTDSMIQPDISGLYNQTFQQKAYSMGMRYIISDASATGWNNPSPNAGFYSSLQPGLLIIPRKASSLFYNLRTPTQWVSEYNCYYGPTGTCANGTWRYWDHNLSYQEILNDESNFWLSYLLTWNIDPLMFHQPNAGTYDGTHSLLGDLTEATLTKYTKMYNLPIQNLTMHQIGIKMANRMAYNASGIKGTYYPGQKIVLTTTKAAQIPLTGISYGSNTEVYGGQSISYLNMSAGQTITITPAP